MKQKLQNFIKRKSLKSLTHQQKGAVAVEYAILAPALAVLIFGSIEVGRMLMVYSALEGAVTEATRISITGSVPDGFATSDAYIIDFVQNSLQNVGVTQNDVSISMNVYESFANIGEEEPYTDENGNDAYDVGECFTDVNNNGAWDQDMGASGTGGEENIMVMKIDVNLQYLMHGFIEAFSQSDHITLSTTTAVRNEPYGGVSWTPSDNVICGS